jgi:hypothetical protein
MTLRALTCERSPRAASYKRAMSQRAPTNTVGSRFQTVFFLFMQRFMLALFIPLRQTFVGAFVGKRVGRRVAVGALSWDASSDPWWAVSSEPGWANAASGAASAGPARSPRRPQGSRSRWSRSPPSGPPRPPMGTVKFSHIRPGTAPFSEGRQCQGDGPGQVWPIVPGNVHALLARVMERKRRKIPRGPSRRLVYCPRR